MKRLQSKAGIVGFGMSMVLSLGCLGLWANGTAATDGIGKPRTKIALIAEACVPNRQVIGCRTVSKAVAEAGFIPLVLPNVLDEAKLDELLSRADALVLFGAVAGEVDARYKFERMLVRKAAERNMPVLGICNGHQQINAAFGGTYGLNATNGVVTVGHRWKGSTWTNDQFHAIVAKPGSLVARTLGEGRCRVNTSHRCSLHRLAPEFEVTAVTDDGVVEAIEHRTKPIVGVQFHPERMAVRDGDKRAQELIRAALEGAWRTSAAGAEGGCPKREEPVADDP